MHHSFQIAVRAMRRKFLNLFSSGVLLPNLKEHASLVKVRLHSGEITHLPKIEPFGFAHQPIEGRVVAFFPDADRSYGFLICTPQDKERPPIKKGEVMLYDHRLHQVLLNSSGIVIRAGESQICIANEDNQISIRAKNLLIDGDCEIKGECLVEKKLKTKGELEDKEGSLSKLRNTYKKHKHQTNTENTPTSVPL